MKKNDSPKKGVYKLEFSAILTIIGVLILFASAVIVTLIAPSYIDPSWKQASSTYQVQMHEISDPNTYVSIANPGGTHLQYVTHIKEGLTLLAFQESRLIRFVSSKELEPYITRYGDKELKLTSEILLLRHPTEKAELPKEKEDDLKIEYYELYRPGKREVFALSDAEEGIDSWAETNFNLLGMPVPYDTSEGTLFVKNPKEYRVRETAFLGARYWLYDENGEPVEDLEQLKKGRAKFISRADLIQMGEDIYRIEGCWYCHTDQTRTLVQDVVLNGSPKYPAPPSSANEYIYERVTFPGTRRIGPDLSRVGVKRPNRDWHLSHFWSPKLESRGSVMPAFTHFFDDDPTGSTRNPFGIPNYKFEAIFQYLMTKGTRITPPTQAWWLGKDPIQTIDIIEGNK